MLAFYCIICIQCFNIYKLKKKKKAVCLCINNIQHLNAELYTQKPNRVLTNLTKFMAV